MYQIRLPIIFFPPSPKKASCPKNQLKICFDISGESASVLPTMPEEEQQQKEEQQQQQQQQQKEEAQQEQGDEDEKEKLTKIEIDADLEKKEETKDVGKQDDQPPNADEQKE